jgi:hypothetical protein
MRTINRYVLAGIILIVSLLPNSIVKAQTSLPSVDELETNLIGAMNSIAAKHCCINFCRTSDAPTICDPPPRREAICGECINGQGEVGVYTQDLNTQSNDTTLESPIVGKKDIPELDSMIKINSICLNLITVKSDSINSLEKKIQDEILLLLQKPGKVIKLKSLMKNKNRLANDLIRLNKIQSRISVFALNHYMLRVSSGREK